MQRTHSPAFNASNARSNASRPRARLHYVLLATGIAGSMLLALPSSAQTTQPAAPVTTTDVANPARLQRSMLTDLAEGNRAEVQAGQLALQKSQSDEVKKFAQMMVDDHGKALSEVVALAQSKGIKLADGIGAVNKTKELALKALSGTTFDSQYIKRVGVGDHESTLKLLKKIQTDSHDADMQALADKMLPTVQHHLEMAKELAQAN